MNGCMVFRNGVPARMDLHDDIQGGLSIAPPSPIFETEADAREAALSESTLWEESNKYDIRPVSITIGEPIPVNTDYEDEDEDEDEDEVCEGGC